MPTILLTVPDALHALIDAEAKQSGQSRAAVAVKRLSKSYKIEYAPPKRGWKKGVSRKTAE